MDKPLPVLDGQESFDAYEQARVTAQAMVEAEQHADPSWTQAVLDLIRRLAMRRVSFTTDLVWEEMAREGIGKPREPRTIGTMMKKAQRQGYVEPTDDFVLSKRPGTHTHHVRVWRGLARSFDSPS